MVKASSASGQLSTNWADLMERGIFTTCAFDWPTLVKPSLNFLGGAWQAIEELISNMEDCICEGSSARV